MKHKSKWLLKIPFIMAALIAVILVVTGCVSGLTAVGWSGGTVSNGILYVGSSYGGVAAIDLVSNNTTFPSTNDIPKPLTQTGLFGCAPASGCGGTSSVVPIYGSPAVSGDLVYIAGYNGIVYAYNTSNLAARWVYPRAGYLQPIVGGIVTAEGKLFFGCTDGKVYALDAATGDKLWESAATGDKIWGTPAIDGETLYIGSFDKKLYAMNIADGTKKWEYATKGSIISTPLIYKDSVIFGSFDRNLYALNASDGTLKWKFTGKDFFWAEPVIYNDTLYAGCLDKSVYVLNPTTGAKIASSELDSPLASQPVVVNDSVIFASTKGVVYSLSTATNEVKKLVELNKTVDGPLTASGEIVYIHTQDQELQRINAVTGEKYSPISLKSG